MQNKNVMNENKMFKLKIYVDVKTDYRNFIPRQVLWRYNISLWSDTKLHQIVVAVDQVKDLLLLFGHCILQAK